ncbi:3-hydroxyacyl-ACP dehydratase [Niabella digestorum]|uniref:3-hydroxyacyl-ACP dehydratase n=1 Tax=Niabella digestorum TaxID=3117701 RepID=A0ABU7RH44_9BACT
MSLTVDILSCIPQRSPFVMVDTLETCDENGATTSFLIKKENIFVQDEWLTEPALIENIAQTAATRVGYLCMQEQKPVPVGFIGAVQNLKIFRLPKIGDVLFSKVAIKKQIFNATIIEGSISVNNQEIASCEMKIFIDP